MRRERIPASKRKQVMPIEDFIRLVREIASWAGAKNPQEIGVGNHEERWRDSLGNEHVISVTWVTWPKNPLLDKPPEFKEYVGEVIVAHKIVSGTPGVFTDYTVITKRKLKFETVELGEKIKIIGVE